MYEIVVGNFIYSIQNSFINICHKDNDEIKTINYSYLVTDTRIRKIKQDDRYLVIYLYNDVIALDLENHVIRNIFKTTDITNVNVSVDHEIVASLSDSTLNIYVCGRRCLKAEDVHNYFIMDKYVYYIQYNQIIQYNSNVGNISSVSLPDLVQYDITGFEIIDQTIYVRYADDLNDAIVLLYNKNMRLIRQYNDIIRYSGKYSFRTIDNEFFICNLLTGEYLTYVERDLIKTTIIIDYKEIVITKKTFCSNEIKIYSQDKYIGNIEIAVKGIPIGYSDHVLFFAKKLVKYNLAHLFLQKQIPTFLLGSTSTESAICNFINDPLYDYHLIAEIFEFIRQKK